MSDDPRQLDLEEFIRRGVQAQRAVDRALEDSRSQPVALRSHHMRELTAPQRRALKLLAKNPSARAAGLLDRRTVEALRRRGFVEPIGFTVTDAGRRALENIR